MILYFLDFILYFEDNNTESSITFGFLNRDDNNIFYCDNDHPSLAGDEMINNLILEKINILK